jgi:hypothetical protein
MRPHSRARWVSSTLWILGLVCLASVAGTGLGGAGVASSNGHSITRAYAALANGAISAQSNNNNNSNGNGNSNNNSNGNGNSGNNSNPLSGLGNTLSGFLVIGLIFVVLFYVLLTLIAVGVLWIAVILRRRLPLPEPPRASLSTMPSSNPPTGGTGSK